MARYVGMRVCDDVCLKFTEEGRANQTKTTSTVHIPFTLSHPQLVGDSLTGDSLTGDSLTGR